MHEDLTTQITVLKNASIEEIQHKYKELFGTKDTPCDNRVYLFKRIAYKLQEIESGGLSKKTQDRINNLIKEYDPINNKALRPEVTLAGKVAVSIPSLRDKRLPIPNTVLYKNYKGHKIQVRVLEKGFEYNNKYYKSLSAITKEITKCHWNGFDFFNL